MLGVHGRLDDMLIIKGVNLFPSDVEAIVRKDRELTGEYRLVVDRVEHLDRLTIEIEHVRGYNGTTEAIAHRIAQHLKALTGVSAVVSVLAARHAAARHPQGQARRGPAHGRVELTADGARRRGRAIRPGWACSRRGGVSPPARRGPSRQESASIVFVNFAV